MPLHLQPQERLLRSESRHSLSRSASRGQLPHQGHAQRIAAEVQEEEQELCYHK